MSTKKPRPPVGESIVKRSGDSSQRAEASRNLAAVGILEDQVKKARVILRDKERALQLEQSKSLKLQDSLTVARDALSRAQEAIDADPLPEKAQPVSRVQQRDALKMKTAQLEAALEAQQRSTTLAWDAVRVAESTLFQADKKMNIAVDAVKAAEIMLDEQARTDLERSDKLGEYEYSRAKRWESEQKLALRTRADQIVELKHIAEKQVRVAEEAHYVAAKKATESNKLALETVKEAEDLQKVRWDHRVQAVLELRENQNAVRAKAATDAERKISKLNATAKQLEEEKSGLLARGLNPYEEFRRREIDAADIALEKKLKDAVEVNKSDLAVRLIREDDTERRRVEKELIHKAYEKKQREELGRHVVEARNKEYIGTVTLDNREILDVSGREAVINPSQITSFPDYSFGLGKSSKISASSMKNITESIRQKLAVDKNDLGEYQRMLGPLKAYEVEDNTVRSTSAPAGEPSEGLETDPMAQTKKSKDIDRKSVDLYQTIGSKRGDLPGKSHLVAHVNDQPEGELELLLKIAEDENGDLNQMKEGRSPVSIKSPKYKVPERSKFEIDSLDRAKGKMKTRREDGMAQVAAGKEFKGQAFVPSPAVLEYKDFQVGKIYRKKFVLTNVSYTFNSFQLLPLKDDIIDFFEITYERPGRMSAGVSCQLEITFTPKINEDIFGLVQLLTQTGPVDIPLRCLKKRCIPRVMVTAVDFGNIIMGQLSRRQVTIVNTGALWTKFTVTPSDVKDIPLDNDLQLAGDGDLDIDVDVGNNNSFESPRQGNNEALDDGSDEIPRKKNYGAGDPALNSGELSSRTRFVMSEVLRQKKKERPFALSVGPTAGTSANLVMISGVECVAGEIDGYSSTTFDVICAPLSLGEQHRNIRITFNEVKNSDQSIDEKGQVVTQVQEVSLSVMGDDVPIYVAEENVDLKCVLHNRMYRTKFELRNRGKSTYRCEINVPSPMIKYIECNPTGLFVQAGGSQFVNIKFNPLPEMLNQMAYFTCPEEAFSDTATLRLPIQIKAVNQDLPVFCVVNSILTPSTIKVSPSSLDFGSIYVNQTGTRELTLTNTSLLAQKVAFVRMRKEVKIYPNDGFAVLLPNESLVFEVTFTALSGILYDFSLTILTSQNDTYTIPLHVQGIEAPLILSNSVVLMRTTCEGQRVLESTMVTNNTQKKQTFEIGIPDSKFSWIKVSPKICELLPGASARLEFEFLPPSNILSTDPLDWHNNIMFPKRPEIAAAEPEPVQVVNVAPAVKGKGAKIADPVTIAVPEPIVVEPPEPEGVTPFNTWKFSDGWVFASGIFGEIQWTKPINSAFGEDIKINKNEDTGAIGHEELNADIPDSVQSNVEEIGPSAGYIGNWTFPIFLKPKGSKLGLSTVAGNTIGAGGPTEFLDNQISTSLPLYIRVQSVIVPPQYEVDLANIDFGQISLGTRLIRTLKFKNKMDHVVKLTATGLNSVGPFAILNAIRQVPPGEWISVVIECNPLLSGLFNEFVEFSAVDGGHVLRVPLRVQGVSPTVELSGLEENTVVGKILDLGNVVAADAVGKTFSITNTSAFPVAIRIQRSVCADIPPHRQAENVLRNVSGLPVFTFKPESAIIPTGSKIDIKVVFQPDRYRSLPFREDLDISVGQGMTDLPIKVHVTGRSRARQLFLTTGNPKDEAFNAQDFGIVPPEDPLALNINSGTRQLARQINEQIGVSMLRERPIILEYPDPYREDLTAGEKMELEKAASDAAALLGAPVGGAAAKGGAISDLKNTIQIRKVVVSGAKIYDNRGSVPVTLSYDLVLSQNARDSGLFSVGLNAKGVVSVGSDMSVAIGCTLPRPKGLGGLQVGSWQLYKADMILKGGWKQDGEPEEYIVPVILRAFVRL